MTRPRPRNLIYAIALAALIIAVALLVAQDQETLRVRTSLAAGDPRFPDYLARLLGHPLTSGDAYVVHTNGEAAFPAMLAAIERAQHRVVFETYIYDRSEIARRFTAAFESAGRRGVDVRIVFDAFAVAIDPDDVARLEQAGCRIGWFNPVGGWSIEEVNYRTHRKALVVDGDVAFVGGLGIADQWIADAGGVPPWRDTMVEVRGPAAINIEAAFNENWIETGGIVEPDLLPHVTDSGRTARSIVVWSSPEGGTNAMKLLYLLSIAAARRTIEIQSPYLITDPSTRWSLGEARRRGVRIRMLVEGDITDAKAVKFAGRAAYEPLMEMGIDIYEYQPTLMHAKVLVVDGVLSIVGSANFDNRSLELNDELNVAVFDRGLAARLLVDVERDLTHSERLDLESWRARPPHIRAREKLWSVFGEVF
jgi:cardiolipin synthase